MSQRVELLRRAANCYLGAELLDAACHCFEQLGDAARAARLHERQQRWEAAARHYELAQAWTDAARCYQQAGLPLAAANCLIQAGDSLAAAWLLADQGQRGTRARTLAQAAPVPTLARQLAQTLVLARCDLAAGQTEAAATRLQAVVNHLRELVPGPERERVENWAFVLADGMRRPDLAASLHAAAVLAGVPGAERRWECWALATLGDATGIPLATGSTMLS